MASPLYADFFTYPIYDQTTSESFLNATVQLLNEHIDRQAPITILMVLFLCGIFIGQLRIIMIVRTINERLKRHFEVPFPPSYTAAMKHVVTAQVPGQASSSRATVMEA